MHQTTIQQENLRVTSPNLVDQMIAEAELKLRHNWSDVAIHDRNKIQAAGPNQVFAWIVSEFSSYLSPLSCQLADKDKWEGNPLCPAQVLAVRWKSTENDFDNDAWREQFAPENSSFYLIVKTDKLKGEIIPIDQKQFFDFCFCGYGSELCIL
jgi:hypothetical protein